MSPDDDAPEDSRQTGLSSYHPLAYLGDTDAPAQDTLPPPGDRDGSRDDVKRTTPVPRGLDTSKSAKVVPLPFAIGIPLEAKRTQMEKVCHSSRESLDAATAYLARQQYHEVDRPDLAGMAWDRQTGQSTVLMMESVTTNVAKKVVIIIQFDAQRRSFLMLAQLDETRPFSGSATPSNLLSNLQIFVERARIGAAAKGASDV